MSKTFRPYNLDQQFLLPPDIRAWLHEGHLALFIEDVVAKLDLSAIYAAYGDGQNGGSPPYDPRMMTNLILYSYCTGELSSRCLERATYDELPYRVLAANQHPDHDSIAAFRKKHLSALAEIFLQTVALAKRMGLIRFGNLALDGTKIDANASKHKAMSYERMEGTIAKLENEINDLERLRTEIDSLLNRAEEIDSSEDAALGKAERGDDLPKEIKRRKDRIAKIVEAKTALENEARDRAELEAAAVNARLAERAEKEAETGKKTGGRPPAVPDPETAKPDPKSQRNFTDPESRIMLDGATKAFTQAYNAQAVADDGCQIIVAADVTQECNDKRQLVPMMAQVLANCGELPGNTLADAGYFSEEALNDPSLQTTDLHIPPGRQKHGESLPNPPVEPGENPSKKVEMQRKLASPQGKKTYSRRKAIIEPVFGQIKHCRGFRQFSFRGKANVANEWRLVCAAHNLLKIFRSGVKLPVMAA